MTARKQTKPREKSLGQVAYEAKEMALHGTANRYPWSVYDERLQNAYQVAARAVIAEHERRKGKVKP